MVYPPILNNAEKDDLLREQNPWAVGSRFFWHGEKGGGGKIHILILIGKKDKQLQSVLCLVQRSCLCCSFTNSWNRLFLPLCVNVLYATQSHIIGVRWPYKSSGT